MSVKLLTEHHLEFLSLTGDCTGSFESTFVKMPHCWKSHVTDYFYKPRPCDTMIDPNALGNSKHASLKLAYSSPTFNSQT